MQNLSHVFQIFFHKLNISFIGWDMFRYNCCPALIWLSFTAIIIILNIFIFIYTCNEGVNMPGAFLEVKRAVLIDNGASNPSKSNN